MGLLAGGLVKKVFSKSRSSAGGRDGNDRGPGLDRGKWSLGKLNFCGDDLESILAREDDLLSFKSSEATITQPMAESADATREHSLTVTLGSEEDLRGNSGDDKEETHNEGTSSVKFLMEEHAATVIQSAFRGFLARHQGELFCKTEEAENSSGASIGTSLEAQPGDSVRNLKIQGELITTQHRRQHKAQTQVYCLKEEWDDSTVSSDISRLRIQNRLEAMTRRERALAYAFSQQLRICTSKKRTNHCDSHEPNMGWTWLERWMATRLPENSSVEDNHGKNPEHVSNDRRNTFFKKKFDYALEERESCGSNDVSVCFETSAVSVQTESDGYRPSKNWLKAPKNVTRRNNLPSYHCVTRTNKLAKKDLFKEAENIMKQKMKQKDASSDGENPCEHGDLSETPQDHQS